MSQQEIELVFPSLNSSNYQVTSSKTPNYNCIAWAVNVDNRWWWPDQQNQYYWPKDIPREETLSAFIKAYSLYGYSVCNNLTYEKGFEKIAIYTNFQGKPTHAARQLTSGDWTSKLGKLEDISHKDLNVVSGQVYGKVSVIMKRSNPDF